MVREPDGVDQKSILAERTRRSTESRLIENNSFDRQRQGLNLLFKNIGLGKRRVRADFGGENVDYFKAKKVTGSLSRLCFSFNSLFVPSFQETVAFSCYSAFVLFPACCR